MTSDTTETIPKPANFEPATPPDKNKGGRPRHDRFKLDTVLPDDAPVEEHFKLAAIEGARYLRAVINGEVHFPEWERIKASEFAVEQAVGKAGPKVQVPQGGQLLYFQLILQTVTSGESKDKKGELSKELNTEEEVKPVNSEIILLPEGVTKP